MSCVVHMPVQNCKSTNPNEFLITTTYWVLGLIAAPCIFACKWAILRLTTCPWQADTGTSEICEKYAGLSWVSDLTSLPSHCQPPPPQFSCYGLLSFKAFFIPLGQISCQRGGWSGWCMYQRLGLLEDRAWRLDGRTTTFHAEVSFVHVSYIEQGLTETPFISTQSVFTL